MLNCMHLILHWVIVLFDALNLSLGVIKGVHTCLFFSWSIGGVSMAEYLFMICIEIYVFVI